MIKSIHIEDISYFSKSSEEMSGLSKINFVYGTNGSGKTTISRVIADDCEFPSCTVKWESDHRLETFVYNSDFVKENFGREEIKGIFTLGKDDIGIKEKISSTLAEIETLNEEIAGLKYELEGEDGIDGKKPSWKNLRRNSRTGAGRQKRDTTSISSVLSRDIEAKRRNSGTRSSKNRNPKRLERRLLTTSSKKPKRYSKTTSPRSKQSKPSAKTTKTTFWVMKRTRFSARR